MIPMIRTLEHIEKCIRTKGRWQREERVQALEKCKRQLDILKASGKITVPDFFRVNGQLLPILSEERWRLNKLQQATRTMPSSTPTGLEMAGPGSSPGAGQSTLDTEGQSTESSIQAKKTQSSTNTPVKARRRGTKKTKAKSKRAGTSSTKTTGTKSSGKTEAAASGPR